MMYGQMTAGSWIYIGTQGILQGTYETFAACAAALRRRPERQLVVTGGLGGMGGAQPLAATMNEAPLPRVDVDPSAHRRRLETRYLDERLDDLDEAIDLALAAKRGEAVSIGVLGNAAELLPSLLERGVTPDVLTDQTRAHDPLNGYVPDG